MFVDEVVQAYTQTEAEMKRIIYLHPPPFILNRMYSFVSKRGFQVYQKLCFYGLKPIIIITSKLSTSNRRYMTNVYFTPLEYCLPDHHRSTDQNAFKQMMH